LNLSSLFILPKNLYTFKSKYIFGGGFMKRKIVIYVMKNIIERKRVIIKFVINVLKRTKH